MADLQITLVKSVNGAKQNQKATVKALGLRKIGNVVVKNDIPQVRGMIKVVSHLLKVEEI